MTNPSNRKRSQIKSEDLNLVPIMNLVTILIPFLLMSAQFVHLAVIDSSLPAIVPPEIIEEEPPDKPPLTLMVLVADEGLFVQGGQAPLPVMEGANLGDDRDKEAPTFPVMTAEEYKTKCENHEIEEEFVRLSRCFTYVEGLCIPRGLDSVEGIECPDMSEMTEYPWQEFHSLLLLIKEDYPEDEFANIIISALDHIRYEELVNLMDASRERLGEARVKDEDMLEGDEDPNLLFPKVVITGGGTR